MPTSVTGPKTNMQSARFRSDQGFSLIEVLVVLAIIALTVSVVSLAIPSASDSEASLVERSERWLNDCVYDARLSGSVLGLYLYSDEEDMVYVEAQQLDPRLNVWSAHSCSGESLLTLEAELNQLELVVYETSVLISERQNLETAMPQVLLLPSGEVTPFRLSVFTEDDMVIESVGFGSIEIRELSNEI